MASPPDRSLMIGTQQHQKLVLSPSRALQIWFKTFSRMQCCFSCLGTMEMGEICTSCCGSDSSSRIAQALTWMCRSSNAPSEHIKEDGWTQLACLVPRLPLWQPWARYLSIQEPSCTRVFSSTPRHLQPQHRYLLRVHIRIAKSLSTSSNARVF